MDGLFASIKFFIILVHENCPKPIVFLTAVLTWGGEPEWQGTFIIHPTKTLEPNGTTKKKCLFSPEAILVVSELGRERLAWEPLGCCTLAPGFWAVNGAWAMLFLGFLKLC